jgi:hypothetical protein
VNGVTTFSPPLAGTPVRVCGTTKPIWKGGAADNTLYQWSDPVDGIPSSQTGALTNIYQIRMYTSNPSATGTQYDSADVLVDRTAHTWSVVYPSATATSVTLTATPASPQTTPASPVTLHANVPTAGVPGVVRFFEGATQIGSTVTKAAATTTVDSTAFTPTAGAHSYTARFDPDPGFNDGAVGTTPATASLNIYTDSTSTPLAYQVNAPADATNTAVATTHGTTVDAPATVTATVTDTTTPATTIGSGTVQFSYTLNGGSSTPFGAPVNVVGGSAALNLSSGLPYSGAAPYTYVWSATYSGVSGTFNGSSGSAAPFTVQGPACTTCTDVQNIRATVPAGTLTITTPYHTSNPLTIPLALTADGHEFTGNAQFGSATAGPGGTPAYIRITDTRAGQPLAWTASALSSALTSGANSINAQNVGLTTFIKHPIAGNAFDSTAANLTLTDNAAAEPAVAPAAAGSAGLGGTTAHQFGHATVGQGTIDLEGTLTINAPTSTQTGTYDGTITFTVG